MTSLLTSKLRVFPRPPQEDVKQLIPCPSKTIWRCGGCVCIHAHMCVLCVYVYKMKYWVFMLSYTLMSDSVTPWTVAHHVPLSMGLSRQADWSGLPFPPPEDLPSPGTEPTFPASLGLAGGLFITNPRGKPKMECSVQFSRSVMSDFL